MPPEVRAHAQQAVLAGIDRQFEYFSDLDRMQLFAALRQLASMDDLGYRLAALRRLTKDGRDLSSFEGSIVALLLGWLRDLQALSSVRPPGRPQELAALLGLLTVIVKFNFVLFKVRQLSTERTLGRRGADNVD